MLVAFCRMVEPLDIYADRLVLNGRRLSDYEREAFARADGFATADEFTAWFQQHYGLPVVGELEVITWW